MKRHSRWHSAIAIAIGILLLIAGIVLLFLPGPGIPLIAFGIGLVGSHSKRLSNLLDRAEPRVHAGMRRVLRHWKRLPKPAKTSVVLGCMAFLAAAGLGLWRFVWSHFV